MAALRYVRDDSDLGDQRSVGVRGHYGSLGCARLLGQTSDLLVSYMPLAHCGINFFHNSDAAIGRESWTRSILVTNSASLSKASRPLTPQVALNSG